MAERKRETRKSFLCHGLPFSGGKKAHNRGNLLLSAGGREKKGGGEERRSLSRPSDLGRKKKGSEKDSFGRGGTHRPSTKSERRRKDELYLFGDLEEKRKPSYLRLRKGERPLFRKNQGGNGGEPLLHKSRV